MKDFYSKLNVESYTGFQCDFCKKRFLKKDISSYDIPLKFPTLKYSTPSNYNSVDFELNFCSLDCLFELLKNVPYGFEIFTPVYFNDLNKRNFVFSRNWEIIE